MNIMKTYRWLLLFVLAGMVSVYSLDAMRTENDVLSISNAISADFSLNDIDGYTGNPYVVINGNVPFFAEENYKTESFERYSDLDKLGRCGVAYANIGTDLMPTEGREDVGQVKPSGWQSIKYDSIDGKYLYNRCHLIGFQLTAENANGENLITGTRHMNVDGMLPFEDMVADYIKKTCNHVLYRVTPMYNGSDLVAMGVLMEAKSVEDDGEGILYNVFVYNVQPGIGINYATGESWLLDDMTDKALEGESIKIETYILSTNSHKFHTPSCSRISKISEGNRSEFTGTRDRAIAQGYSPCGICKP